jgi:hypothetical protein
VTALTAIEGPAAWPGSKIDYREEGTHVLSARELADIDDATADLQRVGQLSAPCGQGRRCGMTPLQMEAQGEMKCISASPELYLAK